MSAAVETWSDALAPEEEEWGPLVLSTDVDDAALAVLREWMPRYLDRLGAERDLGFELEHPREYDTAFVPEELLDNKVPACIVETARMEATRGGQARTYEGTWRTDVRCVVRGKRGAHTRHLASLHEGAARRLMVQFAHKPPLNWIKYIGMRFEEVPGDRTRGRYLLCAVSSFQVITTEIVDPTGGPYPLRTAESVHIDVRKEPPWPTP